MKVTTILKSKEFFLLYNYVIVAFFIIFTFLARPIRKTT